MMTPLRLSGRVFPPRVMQGMVSLAIACALLASPVFAAEPAGPGATQPMGAAGAKLKELTISKTPYNTTIQAVIDGAIQNYNSFKMNDTGPFRIVLDVWGVDQGTVASEFPVDTPQVKGIKISSSDGKLRMVVETPGDQPMPFIVNPDKSGLVLSVGGGAEGKVTSTERLQDGKTTVTGKAVMGIDLEDLPDASNVVITTSGDPAYQAIRKGDTVTLAFQGASVDKGLLRTIDARKFEIPVQTISSSMVKRGTSVVVSFAPGSSYTVEKKDNSVVVSFAKGAEATGSELVARAVAVPAESAASGAGQAEAGTAGNGAGAPGPRQWGFLSGVNDTAHKYKGQRISMDFKDADLTNVFRIIAEVSNLNIITTDEVRGKVSIRLINVPWDQALDIVLRSKALGATQEGNVLRIAPISSLQKEEQDRLNSQKQIELAKVEAMAREEEARTAREAVFDTIPVSYSKASELLGKIKPQASKYGKLDSDDRTNVLIIRDLPQNIEKIKALVSRLDTSTPQVLIEARIVEVDTTFTRELGVQWGGSYRNGSSTKFGVIGSQDSTGGSLAGTGAINPSNNTPFSPAAPPPNYAVNLPAAIGQGSGGGIAFGILRDNLRLDLALSALESAGKLKVVSSPKVVTVDNKEATIEQGTQIPYSTVSASGTNVQFVDATLSLKVTPHITPDGRVSMRVLAKNDSPGATAPNGQVAINKKSATTEVLIGDGETTVIGGILQVTRSEDTNGVPWLSKIPVFGYLFKHKANTATNRELLIFITPKIMKPEPFQAKAS
jgi:type IV pilus assembly protein PilQ